MLRESYVITNPHDDYAAYIIQLVYSKHGLKPICVYTDRKLSHYLRPRFPILDSEVVEAELFAEPWQFPEVVRHLRSRYAILGAIPVLEPEVEHCATFVELLGLSHGTTPVALRRFRDKHAMKAYVREVAPDVRVPLVFPVRRAEDVFSGEPTPARIRASGKFVLKPTAGFGLKGVGFFRNGVTRQEIALHLAQFPESEAWVMEEFIGGRELAVNGQVGSKGNVFIQSVLSYERSSANGREHLYGTTLKVDRSDPVFEPVAAYVTRLLTVLGLRCSPFHLELKLDEQGPCVVDLGARLIGNGLAFSLSKLHPGRPDMLDVAAHGYLFGGDYGLEAPVDWAPYEARGFARVHGIAPRDEVIASLRGVEEVEQLPEFVRWGKKPHVGQQVMQTVDLFTLPWDMDLLGAGPRAEFLETVRRVPSMISWNGDGLRWSARAQAEALHVAQRLAPKARWLLHQIRDRVAPRAVGHDLHLSPAMSKGRRTH